MGLGKYSDFREYEIVLIYYKLLVLSFNCLDRSNRSSRLIEEQFSS